MVGTAFAGRSSLAASLESRGCRDVTAVSLPGSKGALDGYLAVPDGTGPWPGVVVIHDALGMTADLRGQCDWLAGAGFVAVGPDLYSWGRKFSCMRATFSDLTSRRGRAFDDIDAVRGWLADRDDCTGSIGVIGYCMGGAFSLLLAVDHDFSASSVNYGGVPADAADYLAGACPIVGSFGAKDRMLKGAAAKLESALGDLDVAHDVKEYPLVGHSFLNDHQGGAGVLLKVVGPLMGVGHDPTAVADARARIEAFFHQHLD